MSAAVPRCSRGKCTGKSHARGLCVGHYRAWRRLNPTVETAVVVAYVDELRNSGLGFRRIAELSGVGVATLTQLSRRRYVLADTASRIFAVPLRTPGGGPHHAALASGASVPVLGTARRLQALTAAGYTARQLATAAGTPHQTISELTGCRHPYVFVSTARRIAELFDRLQLTPPPQPDSYGARRAKARAARRGWAPPLAWDDDTIDDPAAKPDLGSSGVASFAERYLELRDHVGVTDHDEIAARLGVKPASVKRGIERLKEAS